MNDKILMASIVGAAMTLTVICYTLAGVSGGEVNNQTLAAAMEIRMAHADEWSEVRANCVDKSIDENESGERHHQIVNCTDVADMAFNIPKQRETGNVPSPFDP